MRAPADRKVGDALLRELLGAVLGALAGATIARFLGAEDMIVVAAIAGSFVGGGLLAAPRRGPTPHDSARR